MIKYLKICFFVGLFMALQQAYANPIQLRFYEYIDLETGGIETEESFVTVDHDFKFAYNDGGRLFQNEGAGVEIAFLEGVAYSSVGVDEVETAVFVTSLVDKLLTSGDTVLVKTATGRIFKVGNSVQLSDGVEFDYEILVAPVVVNIPDANLRAALEGALGKNAGDAITDAELAN